jgi:hypothetical protein
VPRRGDVQTVAKVALNVTVTRSKSDPVRILRSLEQVLMVEKSSNRILDVS